MRYRLVALHHKLGGGVLMSLNEPGSKVRKWWFNPEALKRAIDFDPNPIDAAFGESDLRLEDCEKKITALRNALREHKKQANARLRALEAKLTAGKAEQPSASEPESL
jgi:hypothetical protein